jgi:hypothetical protein
MGRKPKAKIGVSDLANAWRAGWSPSDVNAILDRFEKMGDPNEPLSQSEEDDQDETPAGENSDVLDQDEDVNDVSEDDTDDEDEEDVKDPKVKEAYETLGQLKQTAVEVENERLKKEVARLQAANRRKDLSGGENQKSPEDALIDTFQSLFN